MRGRTRYAGAMLLYGPQARPPDLTLVMQFLIDDLRFEGRKVTWIALKGSSLRLRFEGYELVLAHTDGALPPQAFHGVLRPGPALLLTPDAVEDSPAPDHALTKQHDLARGRVLHSLRHHPCALSVLLRPRGAQPAAPDADTQDAPLRLIRECRALLEPVIEAAAPATVIWQPGAVAYTCEEFLASRAETLLLPGDTAHPLRVVTDEERPRNRPVLHPFQDAVLPDGAPHIAVADVGTDLLSATDENAPAPACAQPQSRTERAARRSAGQLFSGTRRGSRPVTLPRLHRQDARLAEALRARPAPETEAVTRARQRRLNLARVANVTALALWFMLLLPPIAGAL